MMKTFTPINIFRYYLYLGVFWLIIRTIGYFDRSEIFFLNSMNEIWKVIFLVPINFIFFEYCLSFILRKRDRNFSNFFIGFLLSSLHLFMVSFGIYTWILLGIELDIYTQLRFSILLPGGAFDKLLDAVSFEAESGVASVLFFGVAKVFHHNFILKEAAQQFRLEKQEAELNFLKSQTNPHFLFNTLNNIYSLAKDKSDIAPESILRLSKILRFMLYETNREFIDLEQEMEIIRDYIALEKLRYDDSLIVDLNLEIEDMHQAIPPLLLMPLVENAFKHGISEMSDKSFVNIHLLTKEQQLIFVVKNSTEKTDQIEVIKENIGLTNLKRQMELLYTEFNLYIQHDKGVFTATLKINLTKHV